MSDEPTLLGYLAEGLSPPLVGLCVLSGLAVGFLRAPPAPAAPASEVQPQDDVEPDPPAEQPDEDPADAPDASEPLTAAELRRLIAAGDFDAAATEAERAGEAALEEEARLFLVLTERIQPGPLASAQALEELRVAGKVEVGLVQQEDGELIQLVRYDGAPVDFPAKGLEGRRTLEGREARRALAEQLQADRQALGKSDGLTIHRYAFWAFRAGLRRLGTELLREALCCEEGRVLVDMFGSGDFERLQRARLVVSGSLPASGTGVPEPDEPDEPDEPVVAQRPEPTPQPVRVQGTPGEVTVADPLAEDPDWVAAEEAYAQGVRHYRGSFGQVGAPGLKRAIQRFRAAQDLIDPLLDRYTGEPAQRIERRLVELNTLIYDCAKQGGAR